MRVVSPTVFGRYARLLPFAVVGDGVCVYHFLEVSYFLGRGYSCKNFSYGFR